MTIASDMRARPAFLTLEEAAQLVRSGDVMGVGSSLFTRIPLALVAGVIATGRTELTYVCWGGGLPLELLLQANAVRKAVFCFSSLDIFGLAPRFRAALEADELAVDEMNALAMAQAFEAAAQRLPSMPLQVPLGSDILERTQIARIGADPISGSDVAHAAALPLDCLLLHAQRADESGNVEIEGALAMDPVMAAASSCIIVSVEEVVPSGALNRSRRGFVLPRHLITAIVEAPFGAYPTSCLPFYTADYGALQRMIDSPTLSVPRIDAPTRSRMERRAKVRRLPLRANTQARSDGPLPSELMAWTLAREYDNDSICSAGAVSPIALTSYLLAKSTHAPELTLITTSGGYVDVASRPMLLGLGEALDFRSALYHASGGDTYHRFYQQGRVTHEVIGAAQVDRRGRVNNIAVKSPSGRQIRLSGQGGMADVANMHRHFLLYVPRHSRLALVDDVSIVSASRTLLRNRDRMEAGLQPGSVKLVTNLGVFEINQVSGEFELIGIQHGITLDTIRHETGFAVHLSERCTTLAPPSDEELHVLRTEVDPLGICRLELVPANERSELLCEIIEAEASWADSATPESGMEDLEELALDQNLPPRLSL